MIDPLNQATEYVYDSRDNLVSLNDAKGNVTTFEYNKNNRLKKETRPMGETTSYQYDNLGNLLSKTDAKGQKTSYIYNDAGRLIENRYYTSADPVNPVKTVVFTYDKVGNLKTYNDSISSATYVYDDVYRKLSETVNYGTFNKTINYTYFDNSLKKSFAYPDGTTIQYAYDPSNRLAGINIPGQGQITYNFYHWNSPAQITLPGGSATEFTYDPLMRVKSIAANDPGQNPLMTYGYTYSASGNITAKNTNVGDYAYQYDSLYRLTNATNPGIMETFTYDGVGNRLTAANVSGAWNYNDNNELTGYGDTTLSYDVNGNTTGKRINGQLVNQYFYNVEDRLSRVEDGSDSTIAEYYYDPFGRRLWKEVDGVRTYFAYSDEGLIGEYDGSGAEIKTYGWTPDSTWGTNPLFQKVGSDYYWYQNDHLGTPQKLTSVSGAVVWSAEYSSFGQATMSNELITNNLRFPGQYYDSETGLHYNWFRYYDPETGRYVGADPIGLRGGINIFSYVGNNPIRGVDPFGLDWLEYTGQVVNLYSGNIGNRSNLKKSCNATSGLPGFQNTSDQNIPDAGPIPSGSYNLNLLPNPDRIANADPNTGELLANPQGGIETIPPQYTTRNGTIYIYPGWGTWRGALTPKPGTKTYGRGSFYLHNSHKGYTHGCIETCDDLLKELKNYRNAENPSIDVLVNYNTISTYGGTFQP